MYNWKATYLLQLDWKFKHKQFLRKTNILWLSTRKTLQLFDCWAKTDEKTDFVF